MVYYGRGERMGQIHEEITLKNAVDVGMGKYGLISEEKIRETTVQALVDTGAITLVINEGLRKQLGLEIQERREASFGNDTKAVCALTGPVEVHWKDRSTVCQALVTADLWSDETGGVLLGAIPLEGMDLMVNPVDQKLVGIHGDKAVYLVM
jgi:predicted aspartyl protease